MIQLNFDTAIAIFISFNFIVVFASWIFYTLNERKQKGTTTLENLFQCSFCNYTFHHLGKDSIIICPRCQSYLNKENL